MLLLFTRRFVDCLVTVVFLVVGGLVFIEERSAPLFRRRPGKPTDTFVPMRRAPRPRS